MTASSRGPRSGLSLRTQFSAVAIATLLISSAATAQDSSQPQRPAAPSAPVSVTAETSAAPVIAADIAVDMATSSETVATTGDDPATDLATSSTETSAETPVAVATDITPATEAQTTPENLQATLQQASQTALKFLRDGGPSIWAIAALSVLTLALILWKTWRLMVLGAWSQGRAPEALEAWNAGHKERARDMIARRRGLRSKVLRAAFEASTNLPEQSAREETTRVAKKHLAEASSGLRALELIATIAPLLGLLGTVMGMIAAFQALQESGSRADPSLLAGGIWEALLTTAAGMAVAIPASATLTWFEAVVDRLRRDVEDAASRVFIANAVERQTPAKPALVAE